MLDTDAGQETNVSCPPSVHVQVTTHNGKHRIHAKAGHGPVTYHYAIPGPMSALRAHNTAAGIANALNKAKHPAKDDPSLHYPPGSLFYPGRGFSAWIEVKGTSGRTSTKRNRRVPKGA